MIRRQAESAAAVAGACWAAAPANGTVTGGIVLTWGIAEPCRDILIRLTYERCSRSAPIALLGTGDPDICHIRRAVRRTDAASDVVETIVALGIIQESILLAVTLTLLLLTLTLARVASTPPIRLWLVAESPIITEGTGTVLPAHRTHSIEVILAEGIAKCSIFFLVTRTARDYFTDTSAICSLPAALRIFCHSEDLCVECSGGG